MFGATIMTDALIFGAYLALAVVFLLLILLYFRASKTRGPAQHNPIQDFTEMAVLFQTLRGIIQEQKTLAREFNQSVDRKVVLIRQAVKTVLAVQEKIAADMAALQRHAAAHTGLDEKRAIEPQAANDARDRETPFLNIVVEPDETKLSDDAGDDWVGLDIGTREAGLAPAHVAPAASPEVVQAGREALRALLDLDNGPGPARETEGAQASQNNTSALRERVYSYHDAGMNVSQIAQELGIGKGEVRLMLGLRQKRANR